MPADVLEAVSTVTGIDPLTMGRSRWIIHSRRLACHALREITELTYVEIGQTLGYEDHTTAIHHCSQPVDYSELRAVLQEVAGRVDAAWQNWLLFKWEPAGAETASPKGGRS